VLAMLGIVWDLRVVPDEIRERHIDELVASEA
jgi:hypothetical protein